MAQKLPLISFLVIIAISAFGQEEGHYIRTIFNNNGPRASGGYGSVSNKFTTINGDYANLVELYGGWYINHRFLVGVGAAATTNNIPVPVQHRTMPGLDLSYMYGQCGLMTEYIISSDRAVHIGLQLFTGSGFTLQYEREQVRDDTYWDEYEVTDHDENWFFVAEPGVKIELNIFRWMRFSPGVTYRLAYGSEGKGLRDEDIRGMSVNLGLKFGKF
jgi:hypothetical protein